MIKSTEGVEKWTLHIRPEVQMLFVMKPNGSVATAAVAIDAWDRS